MTVVNTAIPVITGTAQQGQTLTTDNGSWTFDLDYLDYDYQWLRCDSSGSGCVAIAAGTSSFYTVTPTDIGHRLRSQVTATEHASPPPNGGGLSAPYFDETFVNISNPEWDSVQTYAYAPSGGANPGAGIQADPSGRLSLVTAPDGVGRALRYEIRQSDPAWATGNPPVHRCQLGAPTTAIWNQSQAAIGDIRWFDFELWLPTEFDWGRQWNAYIGVHPSGSTGSGTFNIVCEPWGAAHPHWIALKTGGTNRSFRNLIQLSNSNGTPYTPNRNRRIHLRYGGRFAADNTGWAEAWVDGVNVVPRFNTQTTWADDFGTYMKLGPYKDRPDAYPTGQTVMYVTRAQIGYTQ